MTALLAPLIWFYHAFGLAAIHATGRDAYIIVAARMLRMLAHGANSLILGLISLQHQHQSRPDHKFEHRSLTRIPALFFAELHFSDYRIGLFMTLTLLGDVFLGGFLTLIADRVGRRKVLIGGSFLMVLSGTVFANFENFWVLLGAAVLGVVSATGGDFGPFRSIEESMLSHLTTPKTRADVLAWYVTMSTFGSAIGSEASGRVVHYMQNLDGWNLADAYHFLFYSYSVAGLVNAALTYMLTDACEMDEKREAYQQVPQDDREEPAEPSHTPPNPPPSAHRSWPSRLRHSLTANLSSISAPTRKIMYQMWFLLAIDALADGMVPYSLTNYYVDTKFHPSTATLGDITSAAYLLGAISTVFAGPLARKIGLINTMVFTHVPSSAAVLFFALPRGLALTVVLWFIRAGLNNMDQAPRSAFIAGVVKPDERTAVMGITAMLRTLAAMSGPSVTGVLAGNDKFWIAFVAAGACRLVYDVGLYVLFINVKLYQHEGGETGDHDTYLPSSPSLSDEEEMTELDQLDHSDGKRKDGDMLDTPGSSVRNSDDSSRLRPQSQAAHVRRRSPSPLAKSSLPPT